MKTPMYSKEILEFGGFYRISKQGTVWTCRAHSGGGLIDKVGEWRPMKTRLSQDGYQVVELRKGGKPKTCKVHSLVLNAFRGKRQKGKVARHLDGNRKNASLGNLVWGTHKENQADRALHGTANKGEQNPLSKLSWKKASQIRQLFATGRYFHRELAVRFSVSPSAIYFVLANKTWVP